MPRPRAMPDIKSNGNAAINSSPRSKILIHRSTQMAIEQNIKTKVARINAKTNNRNKPFDKLDWCYKYVDQVVGIEFFS